MTILVNPSVEIVGGNVGIDSLKAVEKAARTCYKTEDKITPDGESAKLMVNKLVELGHTAMLEFSDIHVLLRTTVGAYKDLTRHRHCSFAIESTRYCNYSKDKFGNEISVIVPINIDPRTEAFNIWKEAMDNAERSYMRMAEQGCTPDQMRTILPHSTAAYVNIKANLREWLHIFGLRCAKQAHPEVRQVMLLALEQFHENVPVIFDKLYENYKSDIEDVKHLTKLYGELVQVK